MYKPYYQKNRERCKAYVREWERRNPERYRAIKKRWYHKHREEILAKRKLYYRKNKHRLKESQPETKRRYTLGVYGITPAQYDQLLAKQNGRCAICQSDKPFGRNFHVDHCHTTKRVRGILCKRCNNGLGFFDDDQDRMRAALAYLIGSV